MRVSRPLYEFLPYGYILIGGAAILVSYFWRTVEWSWMLAVFGLVAVVGGLVLVLRRRDYRIQKRHYEGGLDDE